MASRRTTEQRKGQFAGQPARRGHASPAAAALEAFEAAPLRPWSRSILIFCCIGICLAVPFAYAGQHWVSVLYRLLTDGLVLLAWLAGAAGLGSAVLLVLPIRERAGRDRGAGGGDGAAPTNGNALARNARGGDALASNAGNGRSPITAGSSEILYWVTAAALGLGLFSLLTLGLGLAGWLNQQTAIAMLATGGVLGLAGFGRSDVWRNHEAFSEATSDWLRAPAGWAWMWLAAMPFLGLALVAALLPPGVMWPGEPHWYDVVSYHLQIPREWYEAGRIAPLQHNVFSYFPLNVEMHYLLAMHLTGGPWLGMYLAHFMHLAMVALAIVAVYGFARADAPSRANAVIAAVAMAVVPWMAQLGSIAYNEGGLLLFGTLATGWAFGAAVYPTRRLRRFAVAGLMAGFACGSKLTGVPEVLLAVGGLAALAVLAAGWQGRRATAASDAGSGESPQPGTAAAAEQKDHAGQAPGESLDYASQDGSVAAPPEAQPLADHGVPLGRRLAGVATFFVAGLLAFAPWLVKNQAWAGNPIFPEAAPLLGQAHFSDTQVERWSRAHSPRPDQRPAVERLKAWMRQVWGNWQYGYLLIPLGLVAAAAAYDRPGTWLLLGMMVMLSVVWLGFTHLQGRFFILAVPIAALLLARMDWGPAPWAGALVVLVAAGFGFVKLHRPLYEQLHGKNQLVLLLAKQRLDEVSSDVPFVNISATAPVTAAFVAPALDQVPPDAPLTLLGDAKAFFYPMPMSRLFYRTVFDVDAKPRQSMLEAWAEGAPPGTGQLIDPEELRRMHRTYYGIPEFPAFYDDHAGPFVIPPAGTGEPNQAAP